MPIHSIRGLNLRRPQSRDAALDRFLQTLPPEASIATQEEAYTHLALANPYARLLPELPDQATEACFALIDSSFPDSARLQEYGETFRAKCARIASFPLPRQAELSSIARVIAANEGSHSQANGRVHR